MLFTIAAAGRADSVQIAVLDIRTGERKTLVHGGNQAEYLEDGGPGRSGHSIFIDESMALMAVPVRTSGPMFNIGSPSKVFETTYAQPNPARHYDVSRDGRRFLMLKESAADPNATTASMVVVEHWCEELKSRVR